MMWLIYSVNFKPTVVGAKVHARENGGWPILQERH